MILSWTYLIILKDNIAQIRSLRRFWKYRNDDPRVHTIVAKTKT